MDIQKLIADAQARADANGDGKLTPEDLTTLAERHGLDHNTVDNLKAKSDLNGDGNISLDDLKSVANNAGNAIKDASEHAAGMIDNIKDKLFGDNHPDN